MLPRALVRFLRTARSCATALVVFATPVLAAEPDAARPPPEADDVMTVVGQRTPKRWLETPAAIGVVDGVRVQRAQQQLSLQESLIGVPGVFVENRFNFAQDSRISIRGFGARSTFGIRGIKLYVDGIPLTTPDGQGQVDSIDFGSIARIEVLRGPSASLYGSASGGVIHIESESGPATPMGMGRAASGSYGYRDVQLKGGGQARSLNGMGSVSARGLEGYREHSRMQNVLLNTKFRYDFDADASLTLVLNHLHAPRADDPGALTAAQVDDDPTQARAANLLFDAGERVENTTTGLVLRKAFGAGHETSVSNYYTWRDFENRLPFQSGGSVALDRFFLGGGVKHEYRDVFAGRANRLVGGFDIEAQLDDRVRRDNDFGTPGATRLDQHEQVLSLGIYLQEELQLFEDLELSASGRYDRVFFEVRDRFTSGGDPDASGERDFDEGSFAAALIWTRYRELVPYLKVSSAFQVPTTTELANAGPRGGFDPDLDPERAINFEVGFKGYVADRLSYQAVAFHIRTEDEIVPREAPDGRTFYVNAGETRRTGLELGIELEILPSLRASLAYTYSHFLYERFRTSSGERFDGNTLPGIPENLFHFGLFFEHRGLFADWDVQYVSRRWANSANTAAAPSYTLSNLRLGYVHRLSGWELAPYLALQNLFDEDYIDNLRINAFGGRYFEPAPDFNAFGGISVTYHFGGGGS